MKAIRITIVLIALFTACFGDFEAASFAVLIAIYLKLEKK